MILLPTQGDPPHYYRIQVPATAGWITENVRWHWARKARLVHHYRGLGQAYALNNKLPRMELAHIVCELRFTDKRRRDPSNWTPTAKAVVDGFVDAGVFPDDNHAHVVGPDMRQGAIGRLPCLVMHIWPAKEEG